LTAACANTLAEFERTYRSLLQSPSMHGKNLLFLAGLNIDISPDHGEEFPQTKFVPWAAFLQRSDGSQEIFEQDELLRRLRAAPSSNPTQLDLEQAIQAMANKREISVRI
jgi:hypothetical protein